jgi:hypothetical protein
MGVRPRVRIPAALQILEVRMNITPQMKKRFRASGWLLLAMLGALLLGMLFGGTQYLAAWAGACSKAASGAFGGYWVSRNVAKTDPSARETPVERAADKFTLAVIVAACIIGVCLAV